MTTRNFLVRNGLTVSGSITSSALTMGRVSYAGTSGILQDSANLTFSGTALTITGALTASGHIRSQVNAWPTSIVGDSAGRNYFGGSEGLVLLNAEGTSAAARNSTLGLVAGTSAGATYAAGAFLEAGVTDGTAGTNYLNVRLVSGGTILGVTSTGLSVTGTLGATGTSTLGNGSANYVLINGHSTNPGISVEGSSTNAGLVLAPKGTGSVYITTNGGGGAAIATIASTGLSVTGTLGVTGAATFSGTTTIGAASAGVGALTINHATQPTIYLAKTNATATTWQIYNNGNLTFYDGTNYPLYFTGAASTFGGAVTFTAAAGGHIISHSSGYGLQITAADHVNHLRLTRTGSATADFRQYVSGNTWNVADLSGGGGAISLSSTGIFTTAAGGFTVSATGYIASMGSYNITTTNPANVQIDGLGQFNRVTSALKYKQDIRNLEPIDVNIFRPVRYKSKCPKDDQTVDHFGIIADEVNAAGITELVTYGNDGEVEAFSYERLTVVLLKAVQDLTTRLAALENQ